MNKSNKKACDRVETRSDCDYCGFGLLLVDGDLAGRHAANCMPYVDGGVGLGLDALQRAFLEPADVGRVYDELDSVLGVVLIVLLVKM